MKFQCYKTALLASCVLLAWGSSGEVFAQTQLPLTLGGGNKINGPSGRTYTFDTMPQGMPAGAMKVKGTLTVPGYKNGKFTFIYDPGLNAQQHQDFIISGSIKTAGSVMCLPTAYGYFKEDVNSAGQAIVVAVLTTSDPTGNLEQGETTYTYDP